MPNKQFLTATATVFLLLFSGALAGERDLSIAELDDGNCDVNFHLTNASGAPVQGAWIGVLVNKSGGKQDKVAVRTTWRGTHLGEYEGIAPTGKQVTRTMIQIFHLRDGKLLEEWVEGESLTPLLPHHSHLM